MTILAHLAEFHPPLNEAGFSSLENSREPEKAQGPLAAKAAGCVSAALFHQSRTVLEERSLDPSLAALLLGAAQPQDSPDSLL